MNVYRYRAARPDGLIVRGVVEAEHPLAADALLGRRGLSPLELVQSAEILPRRQLRRHDLALVFRALASLTTAGVPLDRAFQSTITLAPARLKAPLAEAFEHVRQGRSLASALEATGSLPGVVTGMIRAGERGGHLGQALEEVAGHLEMEADLIGRVRQALAYPLLLAVTGTAAVVIITTVVIPRFAGLLADLGQQLPPTTRALLGVSHLLATHWGVVGGVVVGLLLGARAALRRPAVRQRSEELLLRTPFIGPLRLALASARVCRALGGMLQSGLPILAALDAAREAAANPAIAQRLSAARTRVGEGERVTASLDAAKALSPQALQVLAVGEASGQLGVMTRRAGDLAAREAERSLRALTTALEPALIILFGGLVTLVAAALLQAVYSLRVAG